MECYLFIKVIYFFLLSRLLKVGHFHLLNELTLLYRLTHSSLSPSTPLSLSFSFFLSHFSLPPSHTLVAPLSLSHLISYIIISLTHHTDLTNHTLIFSHTHVLFPLSYIHLLSFFKIFYISLIYTFSFSLTLNLSLSHSQSLSLSLSISLSLSLSISLSLSPWH